LQRFGRNSHVLLIFVACALSCFAQQAGQPAKEQTPPPNAAESDPKAWKAFSSEEGAFSVVLPAKLKKRAQPLATRHGAAVMHLFEARALADYQVMYMSFEESLAMDAELVKQMLDDGRDGGVRNVNGQLLEEKEIKLDGHAGRALKVRLANGDIIRSRLYVAGHRLYAVNILTPEAGASDSVARFHEEVATKFLDSFKITSVRGGVKSVPLADSWARTAEPPAEGEVGALLKELRERGELVVGPCAGESCQDLSGTGGAIKKGAVQKGQITKSIQPDYPAIARAARAAGVVTVQVVVSEEGTVLAAQAVNGHPLLQAAAVKAARQVVFAPTLLDGKPVKTVGIIPFNFALSR
jgi:TonB family protein